METRETVKRDVRVIESTLDDLRHDGCLCWNCQRLVTKEDIDKVVLPYQGGGVRAWYEEWAAKRKAELKRAFNCPTAQAVFDACVAGEVAAPITRCPMYLPEREDQT